MSNQSLLQSQGFTFFRFWVIFGLYRCYIRIMEKKMEPTIVYTVRRQMSRIQALSLDEHRRRPGLGHCSLEFDAASTGKFPKMT